MPDAAMIEILSGDANENAPSHRVKCVAPRHPLHPRVPTPLREVIP